jgi:hypothetical protein
MAMHLKRRSESPEHPLSACGLTLHFRRHKTAEFAAVTQYLLSLNAYFFDGLRGPDSSIGVKFSSVIRMATPVTRPTISTSLG